MRMMKSHPNDDQLCGLLMLYDAPFTHDTTGLTTGWMFVYMIQPVVKLGCTNGLTTVLKEQPLFVQPIVKPRSTTGLTSGCFV